MALARALAIEPKMLLLDEPFGALDAQVRRELRRWLRELHDRAGVTTVFVTHDQEEALDLADRVAILKDGELIQLGTPNEVYEHPATPFVFDFLGRPAACQASSRTAGCAGRRLGRPRRRPAPAEGAVEVFFRPGRGGLRPGRRRQASPPRCAAWPSAALTCASTTLIEGETVELQAHGPTLPPGVTTGLSVADQAAASTGLRRRLNPNGWSRALRAHGRTHAPAPLLRSTASPNRRRAPTLIEGVSFEDAALHFLEGPSPCGGRRPGGQPSTSRTWRPAGERQCFRIDPETGETAPCA